MWHYRTSSPDLYKLLKVCARENRKKCTEAEYIFWQYVRYDALGTRVLRQHVVGDYIVDFLIPYYNIVIEIDGAYHCEREQQEDDALRSKNLNKMGFYVMRFSNEEVVSDMGYVVAKIKELINSIERK